MNPKIIFSSLLVSLSLTIGLGQVTVSHAEQEFFPFLGEVTGAQVNVRSGQSANFERLCQMDKGEEVVVVAKEYSWYKIQLPPKARIFISKKYIQYLGQNAGGITADKVNIRAGAGIHHTVVGQLDKGEQIFLEKDLKEWFRIRPVAQSYGWITDEYVAFKSADVGAYRLKAYKTPQVKGFWSKPEQKADIPEAQVQEPMVVESSDKEVDRPTVEDATVEMKTKFMGETLIKEVEEEIAESFTAVGYVESYEKWKKDGIYYKIVKQGRPVCYVQGINLILGRFIRQKVTVQGTINKRLQSKYGYPVINVSSVRLML